MSCPEIFEDEISPPFKRRKGQENDAELVKPLSSTPDESFSISTLDAPDGFQTVASILNDKSFADRGGEETDKSVVVCDSSAKISNDSNDEESTAEPQATSLEFTKSMTFFPNDHFDDISDTQLLKIEKDAVTTAERTICEPSPNRFPSTMWVRKSFARKLSLIAAIKEVESITNHIRQLTKELRESNSSCK